MVQIKRLVPDRRCLKKGGFRTSSDCDSIARMRKYRSFRQPLVRHAATLCHCRDGNNLMSDFGRKLPKSNLDLKRNYFTIFA